jgi:hypothetical protein
VPEVSELIHSIIGSNARSVILSPVVLLQYNVEDGGGRPLTPEVGASVLSKLVFWWFNPFMLLGNMRLITPNDLYALQVLLSS